MYQIILTDNSIYYGTIKQVKQYINTCKVRGYRKID